MSGSRDYRNDPPSHQRMAARQAAASRRLSPEYSSRPRHEQTNNYPLEDYPQSRRVFTSDRDHKQERRREYNDDHRSQERRSSLNYQQHSPQSRNMFEDKKRYDIRRSTSPGSSNQMRREDRWEGDPRNLRRSHNRSPPPIQNREGQQRYDERRVMQEYDRAREPGYIYDKGGRNDYRNYDGASHLSHREQPERFQESERKYKNESSLNNRNVEHRYKERRQPADEYYGYDRAASSNNTNRHSIREEQCKRKEYPRSRDKAPSPSYRKENYREQQIHRERSYSREPRQGQNFEQARSSRSYKDLHNDANVKSQKYSSRDGSREKSKSGSATDKKRSRHSRSQERIQQPSNEDTLQVTKRYDSYTLIEPY